MEDLVPLLIFIVIAAINLFKYLGEKGGKKAPPKREGESPNQKPRTLEDFFEEIERKFQPQPREMPEWPEDIDRPDYVKEMEEYEVARTYAEPVIQAEEVVADVPVIDREPVRAIPPGGKTAPTRSIGKIATFKIPAQCAVFSGLNHMRISMPPLLRSASGRTHFELMQREQLKQALIASMVFGQPRAYDVSFDTTLAK